MNNHIQLKDFNPRSGDSFFFDNNIWMFLYCPIGNVDSSKQAKYSELLNRILASKATIWINSMVLSEFSNASLRLDFNLWRTEKGLPDAKFKEDYIPTERYKEAVDSISAQIKQILRFTNKATDNFTAISLSGLFNSFRTIDFNDAYYIEFCKIMKVSFVTDDKDFFKVDTGLTIITK